MQRIETSYAAYAAIYDTTGQGRHAAELSARVLNLLNERGVMLRSVLDLACGTGTAALRMAAAGCAVVGLDSSAAMLEIAQARVRDSGLPVTLCKADMRDLVCEPHPAAIPAPEWGENPLWSRAAPPSFELITCYGDSLSELLEEDDLEEVLGGVAALLQPGGYFCFDRRVLSEYAGWDGRDEVLADSGGLLLYAHRDYNPRTGLATSRLAWFVREIERWWRDEEIHATRAWGDAALEDALARAGLQLVERLPAGERYELFVCTPRAMPNYE